MPKTRASSILALTAKYQNFSLNVSLANEFPECFILISIYVDLDESMYVFYFKYNNRLPYKAILKCLIEVAAKNKLLS